MDARRLIPIVAAQSKHAITRAGTHSPAADANRPRQGSHAELGVNPLHRARARQLDACSV
jgi:hypothetical protein